MSTAFAKPVARSNRIRQTLDVLPLAALLLGAPVLLAQAFAGAVDERLIQFVAIGAMLEFAGALMDVMLAEQLADRLLMRIFGWLIANSLLFGIVSGVFMLSQSLGAPALLIVLGFMLPRFITFVCLPPRGELDRLRIRAMARDRFDSLLVALGVLPVPFGVLFVWGSFLGTASVAMLTIPVALFVFWLGLLAASVWHANSAAFGRAPQRLLTRGPWPRIAYWLAKPGTKLTARKEREAELAEMRNYQARMVKD